MSLDIGASRCKWKYHLAGKKIARAAPASARSSCLLIQDVLQWDSGGALQGPFPSCTATQLA